MRWLTRLLARIFGWTPQPYEHLEQPTVQASYTCLHTVNGVPSFGPRHWHSKGAVPGYKSAGYFCQCLSWCRQCIPC
jgi:hypothetical protein